jgi:hypothetical protein
MPPSAATATQVVITSLVVWNLLSDSLSDEVSTPALCCSIASPIYCYLMYVPYSDGLRVSRLIVRRSIVPFWLWTTCSSQDEASMLGFQVFHQALLNWPPAYAPPTILFKWLGTSEGRANVWSCVLPRLELTETGPTTEVHAGGASVERFTSSGESVGSLGRNEHTTTREMV